MEFKRATRSYDLVFCMPGDNPLRCIGSWRVQYDVHKGTSFEGMIFRNKFKGGDTGRWPAYA